MANNELRQTIVRIMANIELRQTIVRIMANNELRQTIVHELRQTIVRYYFNSNILAHNHTRFHVLNQYMGKQFNKCHLLQNLFNNVFDFGNPLFGITIGVTNLKVHVTLGPEVTHTRSF